MSYILDALRKSEQKRPPGPVPDIFAVHGPLPPERRRHPAWAVVIAGALLLNAAVFGAWLLLRQGPSAAPPKTEAPVARTAPAEPASAPAPAPRPLGMSAPATPVRQEAPPPAPATIRAPAPSTKSPAAPRDADVRVAAPDPVVPAEKAAAVPAVKPPVTEPKPPAATLQPSVTEAGPDLSIAPAFVPPVGAPPAKGSEPVAPVAPPSEGAPAATAAAPEKSVVAPAPERPAPPVPGAPTAEEAPATVSVPAPPAATAPPAVPAPPEGPPADGRVVEMADLPAAIRTEVGDLSFSGSIWSEERELRRATVKNRVLREGDTVSPGLRLEEITPVGAVFSYKGWRFSAGGR